MTEENKIYDIIQEFSSLTQEEADGLKYAVKEDRARLKTRLKERLCQRCCDLTPKYFCNNCRIIDDIDEVFKE